jgi:hypothetical protein
MKFCFTFLLIACISILNAQVANTTCSSLRQICFGNTPSYPAQTDSEPAEIGPDYGCLGSQPNPSWFVFQINQPGSHSFLISNTSLSDLDYILWGPYTSTSNICDSLNSDYIKQCSYNNGSSESGTFNSTNSGEYYVLLITNFSNETTNIKITQSSGTGTLNCSFTSVCAINQLTVAAGSCDTTNNKYNLTGNIAFYSPPISGNLTISAGTQSQQFQAPFNSPIPFSLTNLNSNGLDILVSAVFSASPLCIATKTITAPVGCLPCPATVTSNSPVCVGDTLKLHADLEAIATYQWTGPNGFTSSQMSPNVLNMTQAKAGTYQVLISGQNCVSEKSILVEVTSAPLPNIFELGNEICQGEILFLGAQEVAGASYHWTGPQNFESFNRNTQLNNAMPVNSGYYYLTLSLNGCSNLQDSLNVTVFPEPEIQLYGDTSVNPDFPSVFYVTGPEGMTFYWNFQLNSTLVGSTVYTADKDSLIIFWAVNEGSIGIEVIGKDENGCFSNQSELIVKVSRQTSLSEIEINDLFTVYPNPASDLCSIQNQYTFPVLFSIIDPIGSLKWTENISSRDIMHVNTTEWASGMYFLCYEIENSKHFEKLVIFH